LLPFLDAFLRKTIRPRQLVAFYNLLLKNLNQARKINIQGKRHSSVEKVLMLRFKEQTLEGKQLHGTKEETVKLEQ